MIHIALLMRNYYSAYDFIYVTKPIRTLLYLVRKGMQMRWMFALGLQHNYYNLMKTHCPLLSDISMYQVFV